jgi:hypothetical protein
MADVVTLPLADDPVSPLTHHDYLVAMRVFPHVLQPLRIPAAAYTTHVIIRWARMVVGDVGSFAAYHVGRRWVFSKVRKRPSYRLI